MSIVYVSSEYAQKLTDLHIGLNNRYSSLILPQAPHLIDLKLSGLSQGAGTKNVHREA